MPAIQQLAMGETATVIGFRDESAYVERLKSLGLVRGTRFQVLRAAPLGDPIELRLRGFRLAIRAREADCLIIEAEASSSAPRRPTS